MQRRQMIGTAAGFAAAAFAVKASAQQDHAHHMHHGSPFQALVSSSGECVAAGEACLAHCLVLLADGDKAMAECAQSVNQLLAVCTALQKLAAQQSKFTKAFAKQALEVCTDCEKSCRKHEKKHAECKACADACAACAKECKALTS